MNTADPAKRGLAVVVITQGISPVLDSVARSRHKITGIIEAAPRKGGSFLGRWVRSMATKIFSKKKTLSFFAGEMGIPYFRMEKGAIADMREWLKEKKPDVIFVDGMSQLLREDIFNMPPLGTINFHSSLLPKYRGANPHFWQYWNMDLDMGVTAHYIDKGEDTGDIIRQKSYRIRAGDTLSQIRSTEDDRKRILASDVLEDLSAGTIQRTKQPKDSPTKRARNVRPEEYAQLIDWESWDIERVWHFLRGTEQFLVELVPYPSVMKRGIIVKVLDYEKADNRTKRVPDFAKESGRYILLCGRGNIRFQMKFSVKEYIRNMLAQL